MGARQTHTWPGCGRMWHVSRCVWCMSMSDAHEPVCVSVSVCLCLQVSACVHLSVYVHIGVYM